MLKTSAIVVGAGHCGLAMSRCLADRSIDHVVLERSEVAHSWRTQRWDSLRLLTPNWMTRLPGYSYRGDDPDGYLAAPDVVELIAGYAKESAAPVRANTTVTSVRQAEGGYVVQTDQDVWHTRSVSRTPSPRMASQTPCATRNCSPGRCSKYPAAGTLSSKLSAITRAPVTDSPSRCSTSPSASPATTGTWWSCAGTYAS
jgi:putative flavoprotein involved in K+ transport